MVKAETMTDIEDRKMEGNNILEKIEETQIIKRKNLKNKALKKR